MQPCIYFDCELTDLQRPELLSLGMVAADGNEFYAELDPLDPPAAATLERACGFVDAVVLSQWGRVPGGQGSRPAIADKAARWLLSQAARLGQPALVAHDRPVDYQLLEHLLRDSALWATLGGSFHPLNVSELTDTFEGAMVADDAWARLRRRGLDRHHALADAHALRAAHIAVITGRRVRL